MNRTGQVYMKEMHCGTISETDEGYKFAYTDAYLQKPNAEPISNTMALSHKIFVSKTLFPFFDGLIPEGWLLDIAHTKWNLKYTDRMGLLLACCKSCIGAVSITNEKL